MSRATWTFFTGISIRGDRGYYGYTMVRIDVGRTRMGHG